MNATYNMDHLQAITHVTGLLNNKATPGAPAKATLGATAAITPKSAVTSHYDASGQEVATVSNTSYAGVNFAPDGTVSGGTLSHISATPGNGPQLSSTSVNFLGNGKPGSAQIDVNNTNGPGIFKHVQMDMGAASWNDSFAISAGQVAMSSVDGQTRNKLHDCTLQFNNEALASGAITHYDPDTGAVVRHSEVDYTGAKFLGTNIVGGQYSVKSLNANKAVSSTSVISVSPLGRLQSIESTNVDPASGTVTSKVRTDFSKIVYNARNEFASGEINYAANDSKGNLLSQTTITYNNLSPSLSTTLVYKKGQLQTKIVVDYANCRFNNEHQVVNSTKKVEIYSGRSGKLLASTVIAYDKFGKKIEGNKPPIPDKKPSAPPTKKQAVAPASTAALGATAKPASGQATTGQAPAPLQVAVGVQHQRQETRRPDGTLESMSDIALDNNNRPLQSFIQLFAADGTTIIKQFTIDMSGMNYDANSQLTSGGALKVQSQLGTGILTANSNVQF